VQLSHPSSAIQEKYDDSITDAIQKASFWVVAIWVADILFISVPKYVRNRFTIEIMQH